LPRCASQVIDRDTQGDTRGAAQVLIVVPRPLPAPPLVVRRKYLILAIRSLPATPLVVFRRYLTELPKQLPQCRLLCAAGT
jgi:hypothetical protein